MAGTPPLVDKARQLRATKNKIQIVVDAQAILTARVDILRTEMQMLVHAGESTGDPIWDHLIKNRRADDLENYKRLRTIERSLKGKVGELIAVLCVEYVLVRSDRPREAQPKVLIGVVQNEHLIFTDKRLDGEMMWGSIASLPVARYAEKHLSRWRVLDGRIDEGFPHAKFEMTSEKRLKKSSLQEYTGHVLVGTKAVRSLAIPYQYGLQSEYLWGAGDPEKIFKDVGFLELDGS